MGKLRESQEAHDAHLAHSLKKQRMAGKFWYSKQQRRDSDKKGYPRFFCMVEGEIKEYTQMEEMLRTGCKIGCFRSMYDLASH